MYRKPWIVIAGAAALALVGGLTNQHPASASTSTEDTQISVTNDGVSLVISVQSLQQVIATHVKVSDPRGETIFDKHSDSPVVEWVPTTAAVDGVYTWEVRVVTVPSDSQTSLDHWTSGAKGTSLDLIQDELKSVHHRFGRFESRNGVLQELTPGRWSQSSAAPSTAERLLGALLHVVVPAAHAQQTFTSNVIIDKTLPELQFDDGAAGMDWTVSGQSSIFVIGENILTAPFVIDSGAPASSLWIENTGDIGIGTATPDTSIHIADTAPTVRYQDTNDDDHLWQTYVTGKDFVIRDQTSLTSPVRIRNATPTNMLELSTSGANFSSGSMFVEHQDVGTGSVGVGTFSPAASLHIVRSDGSAQIRVTEGTGITGGRVLYQLENNGGVNFRMVDTSGGGDDWSFLSETTTSTPGFSITRIGSGVREFRVAPNGDLFTSGAVNPVSSRSAKNNFGNVDGETILGKLDRLPILTWSYKHDDTDAVHIGPVAEDFFEVFALGSDNKHLSLGDAAGVALAATKALREKTARLEAENTTKGERIAELEQRLARLEALVAEGQ